MLTKVNTGPFEEFKKKYPEILYRKIFDYDYQGVSFMVYKPKPI